MAAATTAPRAPPTTTGEEDALAARIRAYELAARRAALTKERVRLLARRGQRAPAEADNTSRALVTPLCRPLKGDVNGERWCERRRPAQGTQDDASGHTHVHRCRCFVARGRRLTHTQV